MSEKDIKNTKADLVSPEEITGRLDEGYKYGFRDEVKNVRVLPKGINEDIVRQISALKGEPEWMTEFRVKSYHQFEAMPMPDFGHIDTIDFQDMHYYVKASDQTETSWDDVPEEIKNTFEKLGIPQAEREYLSGVTTQYESEDIHRNRCYKGRFYT